MSEGLRGALNAMLYRTGDQSRDFVVVLATNRPGAVHAVHAVLYRVLWLRFAVQLHVQATHGSHLWLAVVDGLTNLLLCFPVACAGDLDPAVIDRMDEALEFALPSSQER